MAIREWPQQWPTFLVELTDLAKRPVGYNEFQIEIILLVLQRLTEDVAIFQSIDSVRRKDLHQSLTNNMGEIFDFLSQLLQIQVRTFQQHDTQEGPDALLYCRLARSVIMCFQVNVEWAPITHIMAHDGQLLQQLCVLLSIEKLRLPAAECLLQVSLNWQYDDYYLLTLIRNSFRSRLSAGRAR